ncbi:hypothetical protein AQUCO_02700405v1 [Aquilegia coerulea]|uniref:F-box domain-containing protein n=1 Tax=Aquilegia coerulea TaxID=218851 RepID=A0A2G5D6Q3_AQUCA|nr:hypothetical protein AQUCO_02700405v1 [Aquilegia coerulea]
MVKKRKKNRDDYRMGKGKKRNRGRKKYTSLPLLSSSDMIVEILSRLPVKTTCRFKCVCKHWQSLITDRTRWKLLPPLTGFFYKQNFQPNPVDKNKNEINFYNFGSQINSTDIQFDTTLSFLERPTLAPVASYKGFVLCVEKSNQGTFFAFHCLQFVLCNPLTKQWTLLPKPLKPHHWYHIKNVVLFCYDNVESHGGQMEFMVVSLYFCSKNALELEIYSSETGEWKESIVSHQLHYFSPCGGHVVFDGSIYFCNIYHRNVCVYDLKEKSTCSLKMPTGEYKPAFHGCLGVSSGTLCFAETNITCFSVWVLVDGVEWVLKHRIEYESFMNLDEFSNILTYGHELWPLAFHPENYMVLARSSYRRNIVLYHIEGGKIEPINNIDIDAPYPVIPYHRIPAWPLCIMNTK